MTKLRALTPLLLLAAAPAWAEPEAPTLDGWIPSVGLAVSFPVASYSEYRLGASLRVGLDREVADGQRVGGGLTYTRHAIRGATLELPGLEATYRLRPFESLGLNLGGAVGVLMLREAFDATLSPSTRLADVTTRVGVPVELRLSWTLFEHLELGASYRQTFLFNGEGPANFGQVGVSIGGRL